jgi:hypothetical protein
MPMIATTIINSINVKPCWIRFISCLLGRLRKPREPSTQRCCDHLSNRCASLMNLQRTLKGKLLTICFLFVFYRPTAAKPSILENLWQTAFVDHNIMRRGRLLDHAAKRQFPPAHRRNAQIQLPSRGRRAVTPHFTVPLARPHANIIRRSARAIQ